MLTIYWLCYCLVGAFSGILAGLLGVGGGIVIVPMLTFLFTEQHLPSALILKLALGTSLASIMFTSLSSMRAHHGAGAVRWPIVRSISLGILAGGFFGSWVAAQLPSRLLKGFFILFLFYVAYKMLRPDPPAASKATGTAGMIGAGTIIGGISSLVGIGGGTMSVPLMLRCNIPLHHAIGTSAAIGFPIAFAGAVGYAINGFKVAALPVHSLGFVYLPALIGISVASIATAPIGARLAHRLPVDRLKKIFAGLLLVIGTKMLLTL
jgi:uncharacterized protein